MKDLTKVKILIIILFLGALVSVFIMGYLIGLDIGKERGTSYTFVFTNEPIPDDIEPKPSKGEGKI